MIIGNNDENDTNDNNDHNDGNGNLKVMIFQTMLFQEPLSVKNLNFWHLFI